MPIVENILDHKVLGPAIKRGLHEGELKGELKILRRLIKKRFGAIPSWLEKRLAACSTAELEAMSDRVLDAATLQDLRK